MYISFFFLFSFFNYKQTLLATSSHTQPLDPPWRLNDLSAMNFSHVSKIMQLFNHIFFKSLISIKVITLNSLSLTWKEVKWSEKKKESEIWVIRKRRIRAMGAANLPLKALQTFRNHEVRSGRRSTLKYSNALHPLPPSPPLGINNIILYIMYFIFSFCGKGKQYLFVN